MERAFLRLQSLQAMLQLVRLLRAPQLPELPALREARKRRVASRAHGLIRQRVLMLPAAGAVRRVGPIWHLLLLLPRVLPERALRQERHRHRHRRGNLRRAACRRRVQALVQPWRIACRFQGVHRLPSRNRWCPRAGGGRAGRLQNGSHGRRLSSTGQAQASLLHGSRKQIFGGEAGCARRGGRDRGRLCGGARLRQAGAEAADRGAGDGGGAQSGRCRSAGCHGRSRGRRAATGGTCGSTDKTSARLQRGEQLEEVLPRDLT
mmetsp:Transcript_166229/g.533735  ORF Transcript_166229/g.533735 Transcript_166229/m.533735 type:complete len:263 (+) Transcript_166229:1458-2246(+)